MSDEKDSFYEEDVEKEDFINEEDDVSLEDVLSEPVEEENVGDVGPGEREEWQLSEEEEKQLNTLLEKRQKEDLVMKTYQALENKPDEETISMWKKKFGDVYLLSLSERENFIFRALKRQEWRQLMTQVAKLPEAKKTEAIMMRAVLYPKLTDSTVALATAGAPDTIRNLILEASNFLEPERAVQLVRKL